MGFESVTVRLDGVAATSGAALAAVRELPDVRPDPDSELTPDSRCFAVDDGRHVVEIEVWGDPPRVSCRSAVCQPESADDVLADVAGRLATRLGARVTVNGVGYDPLDPETLTQAIREDAGNQRGYWTKMFGPEQFRASTRDAFAWLIARHAPVPA